MPRLPYALRCADRSSGSVMRRRVTAEESLAAIAAEARGTLLSFDPVRATSLGSHADDDRLPDFTVSAVRDHVSDIDDLLTAIDGVDDLALPVDALVDLEILRARLTAEASI